MTFKEALEENNELEIIKNIKNGVNLNELVGYSYPIFYSIRNRNLKMIEFMLQNGANVNICSAECFNTPLSYAGSMKEVDIIRLLISYGADIQFLAMSSTEADYSLNMSHFDMHSELIYWYYNWNPFFCAYDFGYIGGVKYILQNNIFKMKKHYLNYFKKPKNKIQHRIKFILEESIKKFSPHRYHFFCKERQNNIFYCLNIKNKLEKNKNIYLPPEIWYKICEFI
tara:strand:- start:217 stop:894 length:678 start_codon:yes stop_codon:yes gene_type:complete